MKIFVMNNPCVCVPNNGTRSACTELSGKCPHRVLHEHSSVCKRVCYGNKCIAVEIYICSYKADCGINDVKNLKVCGHNVPHIKKADCNMGCHRDNYNDSKCRMLWAPTPSVEGLPINRVLIAKSTPKATRYHIRNK